MKTPTVLCGLLRWALILALTAPVACQDYPFVPYVAPTPKPSSEPTSTSETFSVTAVPSTDVLLVVDSSGSMADKQARLAANAQQFIDTLVASGDPFRIGLVTTDVVSKTEAGRLHDFGSGTYYLDAPSKTDLQAGPKQTALVQAFVKAVQAVGIQGDSRESALASALAAVSAPDQANPNITAHNAGFLRDSADLAVVILTDEDDCSRTPASIAKSGLTGWSAEDCYDPNLESERLQPADVINGLAAVKGGNVTRVRAGIIMAGLTGTDGSFAPTSCLLQNNTASAACGCWSYSGTTTATTYCAINSRNGQACDVSTSSSCDASTSCVQPATDACLPECSAMGGYRYDAFLQGLASSHAQVAAPVGIAAGSICVNTFADTLSQIASNVIAPSCFVLGSVPAADATLSVDLQLSGSASTTALPRLGPGQSASTCQTCGECPGGGWTLTGQTVCLACGLFMQPGDSLHVRVNTPG